MAKNVSVRDLYTGRRGYLDDTDFNRSMREWGQQIQRSAKVGAQRFLKGKRKASHTYQSGPKKGKIEYRLREHISYYFRSDAGEVSGIAFKFPVHGIFREYGVGRGRSKMMLNRNVSNWISDPIDRGQDRLLELVAEHQSDKYVRVFMGVNKK